MDKQLVTITSNDGVTREIWLTDRDVDRLVRWVERYTTATVGMMTRKVGK